MDLLEQFLTEDATPSTRKILLEAISEIEQRKARKEFTFDRFNVYLDASKGVAVIEDELDTSSGGAITLSLTEFTAALGKS